MIKNFIIIFVLALLITSCSGERKQNQDAANEHDHNGHENHAVPAKGKTYTCPMHPEIIRDEPGQCPICKMDLVEKKEEPKADIKMYTCPMHPEIIQDKPGICPKCKMDLVEKAGSETTKTEGELDILLKPTNKFVISQVKTTSLKNETIPITVEATGRVYYDTREISVVSSKVAGRIEKLYVKYLYQPIQKGQKLMDIYSRELLTEQENYLYLLKNDPENVALVKTAKDRLLLQGITVEQIKKIEVDKKIIEFVTVYSPFTGHLHDLIESNNASDMATMPTATQNELAIKEGMYVKKGQGVFNIYNTNKLWVVLSIYTDKISLVKKGQSVKLLIDSKELKESNLKIDFIEPEIKTNQNSVSARVYISNPNSAIKIGSNVKAIINAGNMTGGFIPATAVVHLGNNSVVFVKKNDIFMAKSITVGVKINEMINVTAGISENDVIAENAQLLMDSESFIKSEKLGL